MPDFNITQMAYVPSEKPGHTKLNNSLWISELQRRQYGPFSFTVTDITASSLKMTITDYWQDIGGYVTTGGDDWLARKFAIEYKRVTGPGFDDYCRWENIELSWDAVENGWSATIDDNNRAISYIDGGTTKDTELGTGASAITLLGASGQNFTVWSMNIQG